MMDLLEKAIKGLEVCREMDNPPGWRCTDCVECPYHENGCARKLKEDSMQLLQQMKADFGGAEEVNNEDIS